MGLLAFLAGAASASSDYGTVSTRVIAWPGEIIRFRYTRTGHAAPGYGEVAGVYKMDILTGPSYPSPTGKGQELSDPFDAVCVDLLTVIHPYRRYDWTIVDLEDVPDTGFGPMGATRAGNIKELFARHSPDMLTTAAEKAALSVLTWEIVLEDEWTGGDKPWGLDGGYLTITKLSTTAQGYFDAWMGELTGVGATGEIYALRNSTTQDFGIVLPGDGLYLPPVAPEPLTLLALGLAVAGLAGYVRRRQGFGGQVRRRNTA